MKSLSTSKPAFPFAGLLNRLAAASGALLLALAPSLAEAGPVIVRVTGVRQPVGMIRAELCTANTFLTQSCEFAADAPAAAEGAVVTFAEVPPGRYAVQLFHDVHGDKRLRRGAFGAPIEGVGFSNDASLGLTGPRFSSAAFAHGETDQTITVKLRFLLPTAKP